MLDRVRIEGNVYLLITSGRTSSNVPWHWDIPIQMSNATNRMLGPVLNASTALFVPTTIGELRKGMQHNVYSFSLL